MTLRTKLRLVVMPNKERPITEQFRLSAKAWVKREEAACLLEETKTATLSQLMLKQGDMPVSRAEMNVKASKDWTEFVASMVKARSAANLAKVRMEWVRIDRKSVV